MTVKNTELLKDISAIADKCDRCGSCHLVCPLFAVSDKEAAGARGKVNAARALVQGETAPETDILETAEYCLLCGACTATCASKVKTPDVMLKVRQCLAPVSKKQFGLSDEQKAIAEQAFHTLCNDCSNLPASNASEEGKVAYFYGCTARLTSPNTAVETVKTLNSLAEVELVNNTCCGLPALTRGRIEVYKDATKKNIELYENAETIVCDCAGCSDTLKQAATYLANDQEWSERAKEFSKKVVSLTEYLGQTGYTPAKRSVKITYHEPCHLGRSQGIKKAPRELLKSAGEYIEMNGADVCCGGSCFIPTDYPEAAEALMDKKRANIEKTGAELVVTECHRCLSQLQKAAEKSNGKFKAVHISQIL